MDRKNIGILLLGGNDWVGGLYYVLNVIWSLNILEDDQKPNLVVFYGSELAKSHLDELEYPYIIKVNYNKHFFFKVFHKTLSELTNRDFRIAKYCKKYNLSAVYPYNYSYETSTKSKIIAWFPDFQHKFLPHFFTKKDIVARDIYLQGIEKTITHMVFSSEDSKSHYLKFYPESKINLYTLPFVSNVKNHSLELREEIKKKYNLDKNFFMISNQFWEHKNHFVVLKAIRVLKTKDLQFEAVFTGKETDHRNPSYFSRIQKYVQSNNIQDSIKFLGFIPRIDQLCLMENALAIIQPSKFEGWGTVVEDAKSLNNQTVVSDIPVHHEQLVDNAYYFAEDDHLALAELMEKILSGELKAKHNYVPVHDRQKAFAEKFIEIMLG